MSNVTMLEERPPFVEFFQGDVEDRNASIAAGHYVGKDVTFVKVTPIGGNLVHEDIAEDWLKRKIAAKDPFAKQYQEMFKAYQEGVEGPVNGTPIRTWPVLSPAQVKLCLSLNIRAVEDLAVINDETKQRMGMGSEALKQKAIAFLAAANGPGKVAEEMAAMKVRLEALETALTEKTEENKALKAQIPKKEPRHRLAPKMDSIDEVLNRDTAVN